MHGHCGSGRLISDLCRHTLSRTEGLRRLRQLIRLLFILQCQQGPVFVASLMSLVLPASSSSSSDSSSTLVDLPEARSRALPYTEGYHTARRLLARELAPLGLLVSSVILSTATWDHTRCGTPGTGSSKPRMASNSDFRSSQNRLDPTICSC